MQLLRLIKKILPTSLVVPCLLFADPIGDIVEQTGKGALTRNNEEFVAVVDQDILTFRGAILACNELIEENDPESSSEDEEEAAVKAN